MTDRRAELSVLCRLEIRRTATLVRMTINDGIRDVDEAIDMEFWRMLVRLRDKPVSDGDLPLLRELVGAEVGDFRTRPHRRRGLPTSGFEN